MNYGAGTSNIQGDYVQGQKSPKTAKEVIEKYQTLETERLAYLYAGRDIDRVTLGDELILGTTQSPMSGSQPSDGSKYRNVVDKPYHDVGGRCVRGLSARQFQYLFPQNAQYFRLVIGAGQARQLGIDMNSPKVIENLNAMTDDCLDFIDRFQVLPTIKRMLERMNIEGVEMLHISEDGPRLIPLRSVVLKRDNGRLRYAIICEELEDKGKYYTYINYEDDEVFQVSEKSQEMKRIRGESCVQYIVVCSRVNPFTNFSYPFAWQHFPMLNTVNAIARSIDKIAFMAGLTSILKDPDSGQTNEEVLKMLQDNKVFNTKLNEAGGAKHIGIFSARDKIPETQWTEGILQSWILRLEQAFGLKIFPGIESLPQITATQAKLMAREIEDEINGHCSTLVQTLLVPLIRAVLWVTGYGRIAVKNIEGVPTYAKVRDANDEDRLIEAEPIVGISELTQQIQMEQMWQFIREAYETNPVEAAQRISVVNFVQIAGLINNLPHMQYVVLPPQQQEEQPQQQLTGQAQP